MLSVLVVVDEEVPRRFADIVQSGEQVAVEHILAVGAVEALDLSVLIRLAGLVVLDRHAIGLGEVLTKELRAVFGAQDRRSGRPCVSTRNRTASRLCAGPTVFLISSFIAAMSSACSVYIRLSLALSTSRSLTRLMSDASMSPYFDFHC